MLVFTNGYWVVSKGLALAIPPHMDALRFDSNSLPALSAKVTVTRRSNSAFKLLVVLQVFNLSAARYLLSC
jgi:hypothetical protein